LKVRLTAKFAGVDVESPVLTESDLNKLKDKGHFGTYPVLELDNKTFVSYSNAIMRYLSNNSKNHFNL